MDVVQNLPCLRIDSFAVSYFSPSKKSLILKDTISFSPGLKIPRVSLETQPSACEVSTKQESFTIDYLVESCGLSLEDAIAASQKVQFPSPDRPDSVLTLLRNNGFSETQVSSLVRKRPSLLLADPTSTLLPKFEFFYSIGLSSPDLARIFSKNPTILTRSLERQLVPAYDFLKSIYLSDEKIFTALKRTTWILTDDHSKNLRPNIELLRELGVPRAYLSSLLTHFPEAPLQRHELFSKAVDEVMEMGFDPKKSSFVLAVHSLCGEANKSLWQRCFEVYSKRWGWSNDEILMAFRRHPHCMMLSEKKIMKAMDFFVNKMGLPSTDIVNCPTALFFSLEKRTIPRCRVVNVLVSKGLKEGFRLNSVLPPTEKDFLRRFVTRFEEEVPELMSVYRGKVDPAEV
ncbi:hypothetical protein Tsubulata_012465 [Turnera subulata]|uniref:Uncharacterized protein n=1 Tax=Turnera subulata TaxID=218843 RepID=A0A9Q0FD30_9ROSI|nr:hypothetical protein Tsubulata_012465 [Turnera subulata]